MLNYKVVCKYTHGIALLGCQKVVGTSLVTVNSVSEFCHRPLEALFLTKDKIISSTELRSENHSLKHTPECDIHLVGLFPLHMRSKLLNYLSWRSFKYFMGLSILFMCYLLNTWGSFKLVLKNNRILSPSFLPGLFCKALDINETCQQTLD